MILTDELEKLCRRKNISGWLLIPACAVLSAVFVWVGGWLNVEYGSNGILLILLIFYAERLASKRSFFGDPLRSRLVFAAAAVCFWLLLYDFQIGRINETRGLAVVIPLLQYNGKRGNYRFSKWFYYAFYPVHLLILLAIRHWLVEGVLI